MRFISFDTQSTYYQSMLALRHEVLRKPLGLDLYQDDLSNEVDFWHFGLVEQGQLVACLMILPKPQHHCILKQMAINGNYQGRGLGRDIIEQTQQYLIKHGIKSIQLSARENAIGFYHKLGFHEVGQRHMAISILHQWMRKELIPNESKI